MKSGRSRFGSCPPFSNRKNKAVNENISELIGVFLAEKVVTSAFSFEETTLAEAIEHDGVMRKEERVAG